MAAKKGNKYALGNEGGRPPFYDSPETLKNKIEEYFLTGRETKTIVVGLGTIELPVYTICGLAYYLGFESRQSFYAYELKEEFSYIIKKTRLRIESQYEANLQNGNCTGSIFWLKNAGWIDKTETEHSGKLVIDWTND
jgi:hypothetical protein